MTTREEFQRDYVDPFERADYWYETGVGFIVWRVGTGRNVELLHVRSFSLRQGHGRFLVYKMLDELSRSPPYYSVFGFTRTSNERAADFYRSLGFNLQPVNGLYRDGTAVMFWAEYNTLVERKARYENLIRREAR